jgi:hypothetical protein
VDVLSASYSIVSNTDTLTYYGVGHTQSAVSLYLPEINSVNNGKIIIIKDETGLSNFQPLTIEPYPGDTIDGQNNPIQLAINNGSLTFLKNDKGWWII